MAKKVKPILGRLITARIGLYGAENQQVIEKAMMGFLMNTSELANDADIKKFQRIDVDEEKTFIFTKMDLSVDSVKVEELLEHTGVPLEFSEFKEVEKYTTSDLQAYFAIFFNNGTIKVIRQDQNEYGELAHRSFTFDKKDIEGYTEAKLYTLIDFAVDMELGRPIYLYAQNQLYRCVDSGLRQMFMTPGEDTVLPTVFEHALETLPKLVLKPVTEDYYQESSIFEHFAIKEPVLVNGEQPYIWSEGVYLGERKLFSSKIFKNLGYENFRDVKNELATHSMETPSKFLHSLNTILDSMDITVTNFSVADM